MPEMIPEFRTKYYPLVIDYVADPPFEFIRVLDKEKQIQITKLKLETVKEINQIEQRYVTQIAKVQQKYLDEVSKLMV